VLQVAAAYPTRWIAVKKLFVSGLKVQGEASKLL